MQAILGSLSREEMERRRLAAAQDLLNGVSQSKVAFRYGVSRTTASRWYHSVVGKGVESLRLRRATGRPCRLRHDQKEQIRRMYWDGALRHGYTSDRWTTARLAEAIERDLGVRYDQDHVGRILHRLGLRQPRRATYYIPAYADSRYSPNTVLSMSEISPTVA